MGLRAGRGGHRGQALGISEQAGETESNLPGMPRSVSSSITAAPAFTISSALRRWCSSAAAAKGTSRAGLPAAASLGHRRRAAARHHQCAPGKLRRHIVDERPHLPARRVGAAGGIGGLGGFKVARAALMQNGESRDRFKQASMICGRCVLKMRAPCEPPKTSRCGAPAGAASEKNSWPHRNAGDLGVAEPPGRRGKVDRRGLHPLAHQAVGQAGHGVGLKGHGGNFEPQRRRHRRAGGVSAHAEDGAGPELADQRLQSTIERGKPAMCAAA